MSGQVRLSGWKKGGRRPPSSTTPFDVSALASQSLAAASPRKNERDGSAATVWRSAPVDRVDAHTDLAATLSAAERLPEARRQTLAALEVIPTSGPLLLSIDEADR